LHGSVACFGLFLAYLIAGCSMSGNFDGSAQVYAVEVARSSEGGK
jgi:hypothetical protein